VPRLLLVYSPPFATPLASHSRKSVKFIAKATAKGAHMLSNLMFAQFFDGILQNIFQFSLRSRFPQFNLFANLPGMRCGCSADRKQMKMFQVEIIN